MTATVTVTATDAATATATAATTTAATTTTLLKGSRSIFPALLFALFALFAALACALTPLAAHAEEPEGLAAGLMAQETATYSGTSGSCTWEIDASGALTVRPTNGSTGQLGSWTGTGGAPWYQYRESITSAQFNGTVQATTCCYLFNGCKNLVSVDLGGLDTASVANMSGMFKECKSLKTLDVSSLKTASATQMVNMFYGCSSLESLTLWTTTTEHVSMMDKMFAECKLLDNLNLSGLDTGSVTSMEAMFGNCSSLSNLTLWTTSVRNVTNMKDLFRGCSSLASLDLSPLGTAAGVTSMEGMFYGCSGLTSLDLQPLNTAKVTSMSSMFNGCKSLKSLDLSTFSTASATSMGSMFSGCSSLERLDLSKFNTTNVTSMGGMFNGCFGLREIVGVSNFDTSAATGMASMFQGCAALESLDLSGYDVSNVTQTAYMFKDCSSLATLTLWDTVPDTPKNTLMISMFEGCSSLSELNNLSSLDTSVTSSMSAMFKGCSKLTALDVSHFKTPTSQVRLASFPKVSEMFSGCSSLTSLKLFALDTSKYTDSMNLTSTVYKMDSMFKDCSKLETLDLSSFDTSRTTHMNSMFEGCSSLKSVFVGEDWSTYYVYDSSSSKMFAGCTNIVGDVGTTYDAGHLTCAYAHVDTADNPGYFKDGTNLKWATVTIEPCTYNRDWQHPKVTVTMLGTTLKERTDFKVEYSNHKNAGTATATVTGINYRYYGSIACPFTIDPVPVTVEVKDKSKTFGEADPEFEATVTGELAYEPLSFSLSREAGEDAGAYAINVVQAPGANPNYSVTAVPATLTIGKKDASVTANNSSKTFGDADPELTATVEGEVEGAPVLYTLSREAGETLGTYAISVTLGNNPNYNVSTAGATFTVNKGPGSAIGLVVTGYDDVYDGSSHFASATAKAQDTTIQYSLDGGTSWTDDAPSIKDVGEVPFMVRAQNANCEDQITQGTLKVARRPVTVAADDKSKALGADDPELTVTITGVIGADVVTYASLSRAAGESAGKYAITVNGAAEQGNYAVTFQSGTFTIDPISIAGTTLELSADSFTYDGKVKKPTVRIVGNESLVEGTDYMLEYSNSSSTTVGAYTVRAVGMGNYDGSSAVATYVIKPASIQGAALVLSKSSFAYDGSARKPAVRTVGGKALVEGRDYKLTYKGNVNVGTASVSASGMGNYTGTATASFKITQAANSAKPATTSIRKAFTVKAMKKKAAQITLPKVKTGFGKHVWKPSQKDRKGVLSLKSGKVVVKKGAKKGTYTIKLKAYVAGTKNYKAATSKDVTVTVTVR